MAETQAPTSPQLLTGFVDPRDGRLSTEAALVLEGLWRHVAAGYTIVPCAASTVSNVITLTPLLHEEGAATLGDHMAFAFVADANSSGAVTVALGSVPIRKLYVSGGAVQAGAGDVVSGELCLVMAYDALDGGAGGMVLFKGWNPTPTFTSATIRNTNYGGWTAANTDIDALSSGSTFGTLIEAWAAGHFTFALRENGAGAAGDHFQWITGGGNYNVDGVYDTMAMQLSAEGNLTVVGTISAAAGGFSIASDGDVTIAGGTPTLILSDTGINHRLSTAGAALRLIADADNAEGSSEIEFLIDGAEVGSFAAGGALDVVGGLTAGTADAFSVAANGYVKAPGILASLSFTLAQDTATSFTVPGVAQQLAVIVFGISTTSGIVIGRATSAVFSTKQSGGANLAALTGVLTGTTGTAGNVTISFHTDGKCYVENRISGTGIIILGLFGR